MRFGLVGTGHWATHVHGPALAGSLAGVWGRDPERSAAAAAELRTEAAPSFEDLIDRVDAVSFAVPPAVQAGLAVRAAAAGRHLLLEKPIAIDVEEAARLRAAVDDAGVASVVFFTNRFDLDVRAWLAGVAGGAWQGGWVRWLSSVLVDPSSPYAGSAWRHDKGALWDVGPHALSVLVPALGRVADLEAVAGAGDLVHLVLRHEGGASSTATMTLGAPPATAGVEIGLWGESGVTLAPRRSDDVVAALRLAAAELAEAAGRPEPAHPCDVRFGEEVVVALAAAEARLARF